MLNIPITPAANIIGAATVEGCCQEPVMYDGDLLLLAEPENLQDGDTVCYYDPDGRNMCKLYYDCGDEVVMLPRNWRDHYELRYKREDIVLIGKVVYVIHQLNEFDRGKDSPAKRFKLVCSPADTVPVLGCCR